MNELFYILIIVAVAIAIGTVAGNGAVYFFNKMPADWLDTNEFDGQRIKSYPWKQVFSASFIILGIYMGVTSPWQYALAGIVICFLLLLMGIAAKEYEKLPTPLVLLTVGVSCGFIPNVDGIKQMAIGGLVGLGAGIVIMAVVKFIAKSDNVILADAGLCGALGLATGLKGIGFVILAGVFLSGIYGGIKLYKKKKLRKNEKHLRKIFSICTCICGVIYIVILHRWL